MSNRDETLKTASMLINGERQQAYGSAPIDFTRTGNLWAQVLGVPITPEQVAICMALLKISRLCNAPSHEDSWIDAVGYMALGSEIATKANHA